MFYLIVIVMIKWQVARQKMPHLYFLIRFHLIVLLGIHIGRSDIDGSIHIQTSSSVLIRVNLHKIQLLYVQF